MSYFYFQLYACVYYIFVFSHFENTKTSEVIGSNNLHIETVTTSNNITSYVKRAEGHLLMYLLIGENEDKEKFYQRMNVLHENIAELNKYISVNANLIENLFNHHREMLRIGNKLIIEQTNFLNNKNTFLPEINNEDLRNFYNLSSKIRKIQQEHLTIFSLSLLGLLLLISIFFAVIYFKKRNSLIEQEISLGRILQKSLNEIYISDTKTLKFMMVNQRGTLNLGYSMAELSNNGIFITFTYIALIKDDPLLDIRTINNCTYSALMRQNPSLGNSERSQLSY